MDVLPELPNRKKNDVKEKKRNPRRHRLLCDLLLDFAKNTTLHGLRYLTERGLSLVEKIFWIIMFTVSLTVCVVLIRKVWVKWQTTPPMVPFPAVTICPQEKIDQKLYNYTENFMYIEALRHNRQLYNKTVRDDMGFFNELSWMRLTCNDNYGYTGILKFILRSAHCDHNAVQHFIKVAPKLQDLYFISRWQGRNNRDPFSCLSQVLMEEGVCYTFNSLAADEILNMDKIQRNYSYLNASTPLRGWSVEGGYSSSSHDTYPRRGRASSSGPDLYLSLIEAKNRDNLCDGYEPGFKMYLHHPGDLPQSSLFYYTVIPDYMNSFAISVDVLKTSDSLLRCPPRIRQCYFSGEKHLRYFRVYSQNNCRLECLANYTLARCGCVWFHMPHNDSTVLCRFDMKTCVGAALEQYISDDGITNANSGGRGGCQCLPSCSTIQYKAEILKTRKSFKSCSNCSFKIGDYINLFFKEHIFVSKTRECSGIFELTDFLAYCGGLLGLFLGFSFLSVVEIFYFCTLRLGCVFKRDKQAKKKENTSVDPEKII